MKKTLSSITAILFAASTLAIQASAAITSPGMGASTLAYTVASTYSVTIPADTTIDDTGTINISASDVFIAEGMELTITLSDAANKTEGKAFRLLTGSSTYLDYSVKNNDTPISIGTEILAVPAGTNTESVTLTLEPETATVSGNYTDTLTFTVAVGAQ